MSATPSITSSKKPVARPKLPPRRSWGGVLRQRPVALLTGLALVGCLGYAAAVFGWPWAQRVYYKSQAQQATIADDLPEARRNLELAVTADPENGEAQLLLARTARRLDDLRTARTHLALAEQFNAAKEEVELEHVLLQAQTDRLPAVVPTLTEYLKSGHHQELLIYEALVKGFVDRRQVNEADRWASQWMQNYPNDWRARYLRGQAFEYMPALDRAARDYQAALELKPDDLEIEFHLGDVLRRMDRYREALPYLENCHQREPQDVRIFLGVIRCLRSLARGEEGLTRLKEWMNKYQPKDYPVFTLRGRMEYDVHGPAAALPWLRKSEELYSKSEETIVTLANVLADLGEKEEATRYKNRAADIHRQFQQYDAIAKKIREAPRDLKLRHDAGTILIRLGLDRQGVLWMHSILELDPRYLPAHVSLADYYDEKGNVEMAQKHRDVVKGKMEVIDIQRQ